MKVVYVNSSTRQSFILEGNSLEEIDKVADYIAYGFKVVLGKYNVVDHIVIDKDLISKIDNLNEQVKDSLRERLVSKTS